MKDSSWQQSLLVVCIAGFWIGALVAFCRALLAHLFSLMPYSLPLLIMEAGIACNVAFWVSPMVHEPKMVWAFLLGLFAQSAILFPFHVGYIFILPYHWTALVTILGAWIGMTLGSAENHSLSDGDE
jgi:hypothetical protein